MPTDDVAGSGKERGIYTRVTPHGLMRFYSLEKCCDLPELKYVKRLKAKEVVVEYVCGDWICKCNGYKNFIKLGLSGKCTPTSARFNPFYQKDGCLKALGPLDPFD